MPILSQSPHMCGRRKRHPLLPEHRVTNKPSAVCKKGSVEKIPSRFQNCSIVFLTVMYAQANLLIFFMKL